jgi:hypothetical protein
MIKDIYPVAKIPFEQLLLKNNYLLDNNTWNEFIHKNYCVHIIKRKIKKNDKNYTEELCKRKKILGKEYCGRHAPKEEIFINRCNYNNCKKKTKLNNLCHIHKKYFNNICKTPLPFVTDEELIFYGHNIYKCKYNIKNIDIKEIVLDGNYGSSENFVIVKYFNLKKYIYNILMKFI